MTKPNGIKTFGAWKPEPARGRSKKERILDALRTIDFGFPLPEGTTIERLYLSPNQRQYGGWSWTTVYPIGTSGNLPDIGSQASMNDVLRYGFTATQGWLSTHVIDIDPDYPD